MECLSSETNSVENKIIKDLQSPSIDKRRGENLLFANYSYLIRVGSRKFSLSNDESFDAFSDAVLAVVLSITKGIFQDRCSLKTYIIRIFYNKCIDLVRKKTNKHGSSQIVTLTDDMQHHLSDVSISIIEKLNKKLNLERLKVMFDQLSNTPQQVLKLYSDGYTDNEIAKLLDFKTADVVKTTRIRCIRKLYELYKIHNHGVEILSSKPTQSS